MNMSKKSVKRLESKKNKAVAFIELIKSDENYMKSKQEDSGMPKRPSASSSGTPDGSHDQTPSSSGKGKSLSDEMFAEYKKMMRERQKAAMVKPKVFLTLDELTRDDPIQTELGEVKVPPPLFMADVQHLLLYGLQGKDASFKPRWCRLVRVGQVSKVVAVVLDSVSSEEFKKFPDSLPTLVQAFDMQVEMISPLQYGSSVREDIMNVPISITQLKKRGVVAKKSLPYNEGEKSKKLQHARKGSSLNKQLWATVKELKSLAENPLETVGNAIHGQKRPREDVSDDSDDGNKRLKVEADGLYDDVVSTYEMDKYDRRWLMLNTAQMICENVPTPIDAGNDRYRNYVFSKRKYKEVTNKSPLFAVDCEMVQTQVSNMDLARISFVDENLQCVYDSYVKPWAPVKDYVTRFSGVTKEILDKETTRITDVQRIIKTYLPPDAILVGHSICSDLSSMKVFHPYVIDTSVIYNIAGHRGSKPSLKRLTSIFLRQNIQQGSHGHSSVEDARATMELVLLKLRNNIEFGDILMSEPDFPDSLNNSVTSSQHTDDNIDDQTESKAEVTETLAENTIEANETDAKKECIETDKVKVKDECVETDKVTVNEESAINDTEKETENKNVTNCVKTDKLSNDIPSDSVNCDSSNLTRSLTSNSQNNSDVQRRRLFFHNEDSDFIENFLQRIQKQKRQGAIIDEPDSVSLYPAMLPIITSKKDKDSEKQTVDKIKEVGFCFTHLYGYKNHLKERKENLTDEETTKKCLWKLDRRFWKTMMGLPSNSLFVVILPGREENGQIHSAMTFAKITC